MGAIKVHAPLKCVKPPEDGDYLLIDESGLGDGVDVNGLRALIRECCDVANSVETADPLLNLLWPPRDAIEDQHTRALKVEPHLRGLRREQHLGLATLERLQVLACLI